MQQGKQATSRSPRERNHMGKMTIRGSWAESCCYALPLFVDVRVIPCCHPPHAQNLTRSNNALQKVATCARYSCAQNTLLLMLSYSFLMGYFSTEHLTVLGCFRTSLWCVYYLNSAPTPAAACLRLPCHPFTLLVTDLIAPLCLEPVWSSSRGGCRVNAAPVRSAGQVRLSPAANSTNLRHGLGRRVKVRSRLVVGKGRAAKQGPSCAASRAPFLEHSLKLRRQFVVVELPLGGPLLRLHRLLRVLHEPLQRDFLLSAPHNDAGEEVGRRDGNVLSPRHLSDALVETLALKVAADDGVDRDTPCGHLADDLKGIVAVGAAVGEAVGVAS
mmetsp:Transcript_28152/g.82945  ORF Transcript_28152/g.82945 Transcript_28152/m.82945 type:complete len:329 (-) Transcript_28152:801-1787(-)